jgi:PAS domain S-box-containing protein
MIGTTMPLENTLENAEALRGRIAQLEAELLRRAQGRENADRRFRQLADAAPMMIWMSDKDAMGVFFNRAWLEFRGRPEELEMGNGWTEGVHPDDRDLCLETYLKAFTARRPFRLQHRMERADGEYLWVEFAGAPRFDESGAFAGYTGSAVEAVNRLRAAFTPSEEALRMVFALTERERQVLVLIADGKSTKEAAARLGISYKTADSHRSRILEKLGVHETASMVRYAIRAGLIEP